MKMLTRPTGTGRAGGFTLIELMAVIGIIAVLAGIVIVGMQHAGAQSERRLTETMLANCQSALAELDASAGLNDTPQSAYTPPGGVNPGDAARTALSGGSSIGNTTTIPVMSRIRRVPGGAAILEKLPPERLVNFGTPPVTTPSISFTNASGSSIAAVYTNPVLILDGWNNPIYYAPAAGLTNVQTTSTGSTTTGTIKATNGRPFWYSAGPDGNTVTHDDNVYSTEVRFN
jgi:prepilin-type N-terminal cleavage/methylation domain-containing protein